MKKKKSQCLNRKKEFNTIKDKDISMESKDTKEIKPTSDSTTLEKPVNKQHPKKGRKYMHL